MAYEYAGKRSMITSSCMFENNVEYMLNLKLKTCIHNNLTCSCKCFVVKPAFFLNGKKGTERLPS